MSQGPGAAQLPLVLRRRLARDASLGTMTRNLLGMFTFATVVTVILERERVAVIVTIGVLAWLCSVAVVWLIARSELRIDEAGLTERSGLRVRHVERQYIARFLHVVRGPRGLGMVVLTDTLGRPVWRGRDDHWGPGDGPAPALLAALAALAGRHEVLEVLSTEQARREYPGLLTRWEEFPAQGVVAGLGATVAVLALIVAAAVWL